MKTGLDQASLSTRSVTSSSSVHGIETGLYSGRSSLVRARAVRGEQARLGLLMSFFGCPAQLQACAGWAAKYAAVGFGDDEVLAGFHLRGPAGFVNGLVMDAAQDGHVVDIGGSVVSVVLEDVVGFAPDGFHSAPGERTAPIPSNQSTPLGWGG